MKKIVLIIILLVIIIGLGWYTFSALHNTPTSDISNQTGTTTDALGTNGYKMVDGLSVKVGEPFSIPPVPAGLHQIGLDASWGTYSDSANHFQFDYPSGVVNLYKQKDIKNIPPGMLPISPDAKVVLTLPPSQYPNNITVKHVAITVGATTTPDLKSCIIAYQEGNTATPTETIITPINASPSAQPLYFYRLGSEATNELSGGCWAGGCAFGTSYVTYQNNTCYQATLQAEVTDPGVYGGSQADFETKNANNKNFEAQLLTLFDQILSTLRFQ